MTGAIEVLRNVAGVMFWTLTDLVLAVIWFLIIGGLVGGVIGVYDKRRIKNEIDKREDEGCHIICDCRCVVPFRRKSDFDFIGGAFQMMQKSLKDCSDEELILLFLKALHDIRNSDSQYGEIKVTVSGGKVKFITIEKPITAYVLK